MKKYFLLFLILFFVISCSTDLSEKVIKPGDYIKDSQLECVQSILKNHDLFEDEFIFNKEMPELTVYTKDKYINLSDKDRNTELAIVGERWQKCYPDDFRPLTLWLKSVDNMIITVIFVTGE